MFDVSVVHRGGRTEAGAHGDRTPDRLNDEGKTPGTGEPPPGHPTPPPGRP
jgi:hypothetical protein